MKIKIMNYFAFLAIIALVIPGVVFASGIEYGVNKSTLDDISGFEKFKITQSKSSRGVLVSFDVPEKATFDLRQVILTLKEGDMVLLTVDIDTKKGVEGMIRVEFECKERFLNDSVVSFRYGYSEKEMVYNVDIGSFITPDSQ